MKLDGNKDGAGSTGAHTIHSLSFYIFKIYKTWDFPGPLVVKTLRFHCIGQFPDQLTKLICHTVQPKHKINKYNLQNKKVMFKKSNTGVTLIKGMPKSMVRLSQNLEDESPEG